MSVRMPEFAQPNSFHERKQEKVAIDGELDADLAV